MAKITSKSSSGSKYQSQSTKKKKRDSDFKKVKITPGKKVKRLDDTRTDFKSRKIQINEAVSLQTNATKMLLNKNLKINSKLRLSAFEKLNANFDQLNPDSMTGETVNGLAKYLLDPSEKVRDEFVKSVKRCFEGLAKHKVSLSPYLQILLIYIKCGLTHINPDINLDSKKLFLFVLSKCEQDMDQKLIDVIFSKMKGGMESLVNRDLELVWLVLKKIHARIDGQKSILSSSSSRSNVKQLVWSEAEHNCCDLFADRTYGSDLFDFSFCRFEEQENIEQEFLQLIDNFLLREISSRNWNKWVYSKVEAKKVRYILEMILLRNFRLPLRHHHQLPIDVFITDEHERANSKTAGQAKKEIAELKTRLQKLTSKLLCVSNN